MKKNSRLLIWVKTFIDRFIDTRVTSNSVIIAYYLLLSLFPLAVAVGNILPWFQISPQAVLPYLHTIVPESIQSTLDPIITNLLTTSSGSLISLGAVGLLWSASRGIRYLQIGINSAYGVEGKGNTIIKRGLSFFVVLLILLLLIGFILLFSIGQVIVDALIVWFPWLLTINTYVENFKWPTTLLVLFVMLLVLYRVMPDVKLKMRNVWPGALFSSLGLMALTQLFTLYVRYASIRWDNTYGALGAFFVLMFWLNFSCILLLVGAVLNATLYEVRYGIAVPRTGIIDKRIRSTLTEKIRERRKKQQEAAANGTGKKKKDKFLRLAEEILQQEEEELAESSLEEEVERENETE